MVDLDRGVDHDGIRYLFNSLFDCTKIIGGAQEPFYAAASQGRPALIHYREDFAESALHEIAHWSLADSDQRRLSDYGHRYVPPPRSLMEQRNFFAAELPVQALERVLACAAGIEFRVSVDDFNPEFAPISRQFEKAVQAHEPVTLDWLRTEQGERACRFLRALPGGSA